MSIVTSGSMSDRLSEFERNQKDLQLALAKVVAIQHKQAIDSAQERYELDLVITGLESIKTTIDRYFNRLESSREAEERVASIKLNGELQRHAHLKATSQITEKTALSLVDIISLLSDITSKKDTKEILQNAGDTLLSDSLALIAQAELEDQQMQLEIEAEAKILADLKEQKYKG